MSDNREHLLQVVANLREIADWIEANADLPMRIGWGRDRVRMEVTSLDALSEAGRRLGKFEKQPKTAVLRDDYFTLRRGPVDNADPLTLDITIEKSRCCKKVTVMKPVTEYECPVSILSDGQSDEGGAA